MTNLIHQFSAYNKSLEKKQPQYSALLGKTQTIVEHPTRNGFCYARMADNLNELITVFNDKVSQVYNLPILVERRGNTWYVVGRDTERYRDWGTESSFLPRHATQHEFNRDDNTGADAVFIYPDQFMPLLVYPSGTNGAGNLMVSPYMLQRDSDFVYVGNTGTPNLLIYKPTNNQAIMGLVYLDTTTGNPGILIASGTPLAGTVTGSAGVAPYLPYPSSTQEPLYFFRLVSGTTALGWDNLYNARQFIGGKGSSSTGTSGGGTPGGSDTEIQYNNAGTFGGADGFYWDDILGIVYLGGVSGDPGSPSVTEASVLNLLAKADEEPVVQNFATWGDGGAIAGQQAFYRFGGTRASPTALVSGTRLGGIHFYGYDGETYPIVNSLARIIAKTTQDQTGTHHGAGLIFEGTPRDSTTREQFAMLDELGFNIPAGRDYMVDGVPIGGSGSSDGWIADANTWTYSSGVRGTAFSRAFTNDPAAGANIALNMADTSGFNVGDCVLVTSSAGSEQATITVVTTNTSITVDALALNHTTTTRMVYRQEHPVFVVSVNADMTAIILKGMRIKLTQTTTKYFIVHSVGAYSGGVTLITLYGGTDYSLIDAAITDMKYSLMRFPFGFPIDKTKWTIKISSSADVIQNAPAQNTWYNLGITHIMSHVGLWQTEIIVGFFTAKLGSTSVNGQFTLSTSPISETDTTITDTLAFAGASANMIMQQSKYKIRDAWLEITTPTALYLNARCTTAGGGQYVLFGGASVSPTILNLVSAYF